MFFLFPMLLKDGSLNLILEVILIKKTVYVSKMAISKFLKVLD
jgi:hypothetical protein